MTFGDAIDLIKENRKAARAGWNGKNMHIYLNRGTSPTLNPKAETVTNLIDGVNEELFDLYEIDTVRRLPNINFQTASGAILTGWLASQTDILAEDWTEVA